MKHEYACDHWSSINWAFCRKCFHCYYKTKPEGCSGKVEKSNLYDDIHFKYQKEFEETGKVSNPFSSLSWECQEDESVFTVSRLY